MNDKYKTLVKLILDKFSDDPELPFCSEITEHDNSWCSENCNNFSEECIEKWLELKIKDNN